MKRVIGQFQKISIPPPSEVNANSKGEGEAKV